MNAADSPILPCKVPIHPYQRLPSAPRPSVSASQLPSRSSSGVALCRFFSVNALCYMGPLAP
eukprot:6193424-Pleurochrysis_carterae.AAC.1